MTKHWQIEEGDFDVRLAALSDIHGNNLALQAVLEDIEKKGGADQIVVCGDLFVYCADPVGVLEWVQNQPNLACLLGNTDRYLLEKRPFNLEDKEGWQKEILACFPWTEERIGAEGLQFLRGLPKRWQFNRSDGSSILFVHGSPRDDEEGIYLDGEKGIYFDEPDVEEGMALAGAEADLVVCGHTHLPFVTLTAGGRRVLNLGSVGLPFDGDPRACYAMIEWGEGFNIEIRRVVYDIEEAVRQVWAVELPGAAITVDNIVRAEPWAGRSIYGSPEIVSTGREPAPLALCSPAQKSAGVGRNADGAIVEAGDVYGRIPGT
jgi:diadenosine tetraphosphatase ApaH/serine/threonine PP2A family protein phosphatase